MEWRERLEMMLSAWMIIRTVAEKTMEKIRI